MYGINLKDMGEDELNIPHIKQIFQLLVMQHPNYSEFKIEDSTWAWAHKKSSERKSITFVKIESHLKGEKVHRDASLIRFYKKFFGRKY